MKRQGGLLVVPAAPALVNIQYDSAYRNALVRSDLAIADSGAMVLLWQLFTGGRISRVSGLAYLKQLIALPEMHQPGAVSIVLPTEVARQKVLRWSQENDFAIRTADCYVAPRYADPIVDRDLLEMLSRKQPKHVIIGLGGGAQERLGLYLRDNLSYHPAIHCIGAALGFLTGDQHPIPDWADRLYLGWLVRLLRNPKLYARRFSVAHELPGLICRYRENLPPLKQRRGRRPA